MRFESQTHRQDDHIGRITYCSTRYGQAHAVSTRVRLAKGRWELYEDSEIHTYRVHISFKWSVEKDYIN